MTSSDDRQIGPKPKKIEIGLHPILDKSIRLRYPGYNGRFDAWWGDQKGKTTGTGNASTFINHTYDRPGTYAVQLYKAGSVAAADFLEHVTVVVRGGRDPKGIEFGLNAQNPNFIEARFSDTGDDTGLPPLFKIEWPNQEPQEVWGLPGTKTMREYADGTYDIKVTDLTSQQWKVYPVTVTGQEYDPDFTVSKSPNQDPNNRTARVTFTKVTSSKPVTVYWTANGDKSTKVTSPQVNGTVDYVYEADGSYPVLVAYDDGSTQPPEGKSLNVTVPWGVSSDE